MSNLEMASVPHNNQLAPSHQTDQPSVTVIGDPTDRSPNVTPPLQPAMSHDYPTKLTNQSTTVPTNQLSNHPNQSNNQPIKQPGALWLYYKWINPWIRWLFIIVILYVYALSSGVLTYRNNQFQGEMQYLLNVRWKEAFGTTETILPDSSRPDREADQSYEISYNGTPYLITGYVPFMLKDLWFEFIPALQGDLRERWRGFTDATPIIYNVVMLLMLFYRRDVIRLSEYISIQMIMFAVNALVHVSTTFPDSNGQQDTCKDPEYQHYGGWMFRYITTQYCGDMLWSGHTANTLVPLIIIRRLMWDFIGWNLTWAPDTNEVGEAQRNEFLSKHSQLFSDWQNSHERNLLFLQWIQANRLEDKRGHIQSARALESYAPSYPEARPTATIPTSDPEIVADELALQPHENYDVHINIAAATAIGPNQTPNDSSDKFFKIYKSPYRTPPFVQKHRKAFFVATSILRFCLVVWFAILCISIILIRYHYSVDVIIACFVSLLVCSNTHLLQWWVRMIYRPNYSNYLNPRTFWKPVYLHWPLNEEQINYEERVRRVGIGGLL